MALPLSAAANSTAVAKRSAGSLESAVSTASSTAGGTLRRWAERPAGSAVITLATMAWAVGPVNGGSPDQHLVGDGAEGVHVGAAGDGALAHGLLGRHVVRRAERHAGLGHPAAAAGAGDGQRDAEVGHQRLAVVQQDVLRLDVAVDHPVPVGVVERGGHLGGQAHRVAHRQLLLAAEPVAQALAVHERHDVVRGAVHLPAVDQAEDVGVLQRRDGLDLTQEALGADDGGQLGAEDLDGDLAVVLEVLGEVDRGHAALAQLALEAVAVGEGGTQGVRHAHGAPGGLERAG